MTGKKIQRALRDLNAFIDGDRQKLCDELNEIKLSHKRMERLLLSLVDSLSWEQKHHSKYSVDWCFFNVLLEKINRELSYPYYRVNHRVKGGKDA